jgi:hypothetical protein
MHSRRATGVGFALLAMMASIAYAEDPPVSPCVVRQSLDDAWWTGPMQFHEGRWSPTTSIAVQETLPTGKYDRLGERPSDGFVIHLLSEPRMR